MKKAQYMKYRGNGRLLQDPILRNSPAQPRLRIAGLSDRCSTVVHSLCFMWNAYGLRAAQSSITDTAYYTVV